MMKDLHGLKTLYGSPSKEIETIDALIYYALLQSAILILDGPNHKIDGKFMYDSIGLPISKELSEQLADIPENEDNFKKLAEHLPSGIMSYTARQHCEDPNVQDFMVFVGKDYVSEDAIKFAKKILEFFKFSIDDYIDIPIK